VVNQEPTQYALNIDLAPTILNAAGLTIPTAMQGKSLLNVVQNASTPNWRTGFVYENFHETNFDVPHLNAWVEPGKKLVRYNNHANWEELFDTNADPWEMTNIVTNIPERDALRAKLNAGKTAVGYVVPSYADPDI
jgi:arylsulfatase A-like enzyme